MKSFKNIGIAFLKFALGVGLVVWLIWSGKLDLSLLFKGSDGKAGFSYWYLAYLLKPLSILMLAYRWRRLLLAKNIHISRRAGFRLTSVGIFFSVALPGMAAGDLVKVYDLTRNMKSNRSDVISATMTDRIIGTYALFLIGTGASLGFWLSKDIQLTEGLQWVLLIAPSLLVIATFFLFLALHKGAFQRTILPLTRISTKLEKVKKVFTSLHTFNGNFRELFIATGISIVNHLFNLGLILCVGKALSVTLLPGTQFLLNTIGSAGNLIPVTPGGIGITEGIFSYLYELSGSMKGAGVSLTNRILNYIVFIAIGLPIYVAFRSKTKITLRKMEDHTT